VAGAVPGIDLFALTDEQWDGGLALKFHGARRLTVRAWDALKASRGSVVFISGNSAGNPRAASAAVGTINAAVEALAKASADRGVVDGVQVNCISPGAVMTPRRLPMLEKAAAAAGLGLEEVQQRFLAQSGIERFGQPDELADLIAFALSPPARWMTGTVLRMDGGEIKSI
jgi:3-oxoacyl-[acyl-carrier protein] reductase